MEELFRKAFNEYERFDWNESACKNMFLTIIRNGQEEEFIRFAKHEYEGKGDAYGTKDIRAFIEGVKERNSYETMK